MKINMDQTNWNEKFGIDLSTSQGSYFVTKKQSSFLNSILANMGKKSGDKIEFEFDFKFYNEELLESEIVEIKGENPNKIKVIFEMKNSYFGLYSRKQISAFIKLALVEKKKMSIDDKPTQKQLNYFVSILKKMLKNDHDQTKNFSYENKELKYKNETIIWEIGKKRARLSNFSYKKGLVSIFETKLSKKEIEKVFEKINNLKGNG